MSSTNDDIDKLISAIIGLFLGTMFTLMIVLNDMVSERKVAKLCEYSYEMTPENNRAEWLLSTEVCLEFLVYDK